MSPTLFAPSLLAAVAILAATALPLPGPAALAVPATIVLAALLLLPAVLDKTFPAATLLRNGAAWSIFAGASAALAIAASADAWTVAGAMLGAALIVMTGAALWTLLDGRVPRGRRWRFSVLLGLAASAPLWAAPLAEINGSLSTVVACASPLSLLGVLVDYDYLRSAFFYRHSALGALAYRYPAPGAFAGLYAMAAALLWALALALKVKRENRR